MPATSRIVRRVTRLLILAAVFSLAACGGAHAASTPDARHVVLRLKALGLPVGSMKVYTAASDVNDLLGRPGQYTSKTTFDDRRLHAWPGFDIQNGGSVEVFATSTDAQRRYAYIRLIARSAPIFDEYDYRNGPVLLRLSIQLTPVQANRYAAAFRRAV